MSAEEAAIAQKAAAGAAETAQSEGVAQPAPGKRRKRPYSRHGLTALRQRVKLRGLNAIDRRTAEARSLLAFRSELLSDLGGEDHASAAQKKLVELACRTALFLNHLDGWLAAQPSLVLARKRAVLPALRERQALADSLARYLSLLGLERRAKRVPSLSAYLAQREEGSQTRQDGPRAQSNRRYTSSRPGSHAGSARGQPGASSSRAARDGLMSAPAAFPTIEAKRAYMWQRLHRSS